MPPPPSGWPPTGSEWRRGEADKDGHFAALEQPEILVSEIRAGLRTLRS